MSHWLLNQYFERSHGRQVLWDVPHRVRIVRCDRRARDMVRIYPFASFVFTVEFLDRLGNNLAGQYKRGLGMGIQSGVGNFSGTIASNIYLAQDAPRYILGRR